MSLRHKLTKPLAIEPAATHPHTHTVIFLHRFAADTTDAELNGKVLAAKLTKNHKTLREQFPTVRWVFPHPKNHARPWANLSADDKAALGLTRPGLPYITQMVLHEADRAGGLDRIVLGGQGETAEAAHDAMAAFPELPKAALLEPDKMAAFLRAHFPHRDPSCTHVSQLRLAGFVGMHAPDGPMTRDVRDYGMESKLAAAGDEAPPTTKVNRAIVANTPHSFIRGGYKATTVTWDGRRIDDFAAFLAHTVGVHRVRYDDDDDNRSSSSSNNEVLTPRERSHQQPFSLADARADARKQHAEELVRQKHETERRRALVMRRIEADRVERKIRQERERRNRLQGQGQGQGGSSYKREVRPVGGHAGAQVAQGQQREEEEEDDGYQWPPHMQRRRLLAVGERRAGEDAEP